jgi:site-specific DNA-cytosine methylase
VNVASHPCMRVLSLCSGVGMHDVGLGTVFETRTVCYVEREAYAASQLVALMEAACLDQAPIWSDLATFRARRWRGRVDAIVAGLPCQPYSVAGKQLGNDDARAIGEGNGPIAHFLRIVSECRPAVVFLENVPTWITGGWFRPVGEQLCRLGYEIPNPIFLAASDVGASHQRERVWLLAYEPGRGQRILSASYRGFAERLLADGCGENVGGATRGGCCGSGSEPRSGCERISGAVSAGGGVADANSHVAGADKRQSNTEPDRRDDPCRPGRAMADAARTGGSVVAGSRSATCGESTREVRGGRIRREQWAAEHEQPDADRGEVGNARHEQLRRSAGCGDATHTGPSAESARPSTHMVDADVSGSTLTPADVRSGECEPCGGVRDVEHADNALREGRRECDGTCGREVATRHARLAGGSLFAPGPADPRWAAFISADPCIAPALARSSDERPRLNPRFAEWLMGLPVGWTEIGHVETQHDSQASAARGFAEWKAMLRMRINVALGAPSSRLQGASEGCDSLPPMSPEGGRARRDVGAEPEDGAAVCDLRDAVPADAQHEPDVQTVNVPCGDGETERQQALANRRHRLRAIGNGGVPLQSAIAWATLARRVIG